MLRFRTDSLFSVALKQNETRLIDDATDTLTVLFGKLDRERFWGVLQDLLYLVNEGKS